MNKQNISKLTRHVAPGFVQAKADLKKYPHSVNALKREAQLPLEEEIKMFAEKYNGKLLQGENLGVEDWIAYDIPFPKEVHKGPSGEGARAEEIMVGITGDPSTEMQAEGGPRYEPEYQKGEAFINVWTRADEMAAFRKQVFEDFIKQFPNAYIFESDDGYRMEATEMATTLNEAIEDYKYQLGENGEETPEHIDEEIPAQEGEFEAAKHSFNDLTKKADEVVTTDPQETQKEVQQIGEKAKEELTEMKTKPEEEKPLEEEKPKERILPPRSISSLQKKAQDLVVEANSTPDIVIEMVNDVLKEKGLGQFIENPEAQEGSWYEYIYQEVVKE